jgi:outer membrane lipoprotein SlyB
MTHATFAEKQQRPVRAGVFSTVAATRVAITRLLAAGFKKDQITVITSDPEKIRQFREFEHQDPAGSHTPEAAAAGAAIGATLGGLAATTLAVNAAGLPLFIVGSAGVMAGAVSGGFIGAMMTRSIEKEAANYYDQAVEEGKLLVAVEELHPEQHPPLAEAERILAEAGAEPIPLSEG